MAAVSGGAGGESLTVVEGHFTVDGHDIYGIVPLALAALCLDCRLISAARYAEPHACPKCASEALLDLEPVLGKLEGECSRVIGGELVRLPAGAVMGAEMIAPEQRNVGRRDAVL